MLNFLPLVIKLSLEWWSFLALLAAVLLARDDEWISLAIYVLGLLGFKPVPCKRELAADL